MTYDRPLSAKHRTQNLRDPADPERKPHEPSGEASIQAGPPAWAGFGGRRHRSAMIYSQRIAGSWPSHCTASLESACVRLARPRCLGDGARPRPGCYRFRGRLPGQPPRRHARSGWYRRRGQQSPTPGPARQLRRADFQYDHDGQVNLAFGAQGSASRPDGEEEQTRTRGEDGLIWAAWSPTPERQTGVHGRGRRVRVVAADIVLRVRCIPAPGDQVNAEALGWRIGGSSANVACGLSTAGHQLSRSALFGDRHTATRPAAVTTTIAPAAANGHKPRTRPPITRV
jgi:hypothetical protein